MAAVFFAALMAARPSAAAVSFPIEVKWSATLAAAPAYVPAFDANHVYVALRTNQLAALLIKDGSAVWSVECPMTAPPAAGDSLVFAGSEGLVEARSDTDGRARWRRPVTGKVISLHWDTGWLIAATEAGPLLAIRAADGEVLWQRDLGSPLSAPAALEGDRLYVGLNDGRVLALSLLTGEEIWSQKLAGSATGLLPANDRVFVGARDNRFHSLDARDGDADWQWKTGADLVGLPVLDERRAYFIALDNVLRGHSRNSGTMMWKRVLPMRPFTGPLLSGDLLIVAGIAAELHAYHAQTGEKAGDFVVKGAENEEMLLAAPPHLTSQDLLILVTKGGQVRGVGSKPVPADAPPAPGASPAQTPPATDPDEDDEPPAANAKPGAASTSQ